MRDQKTLAAINLFAVLRNLEDLCELDKTSKFIVKDAQKIVKFSVPSLPPLTLKFSGGTCQAYQKTGENPNIHLRFTSVKHFNQMVDGQKNPIPVKGITQLKFLKREFTHLTDNLTKYLRPTAEDLAEADPYKHEVRTYLTAYAAFYAIACIAKYDHVGRQIAKKTEDGVIGIRVADKTLLSVVINRGGFSVVKGEHDTPRAYMDFADLATASGILQGQLDTYACIGKGTLATSGRIPMLDNLNKLLNRVSYYLQ